MGLIEAVAIGLVALILAPGYFFYFDVTPKLVILLAGAGLGALFWRGQRAGKVFTLCASAAVASLAVSTAASSHPALSLFGSTWRRFGMGAHVAVLLVAWLVAALDVRGRSMVLRAISAASGLAALYGIAQYLGWDPFLPSAAYHVGEGVWTIVRPPGTFGYVSYFATWLLMGGFLSLALANSEVNPGWRRAAAVCAALCFAAMPLTGTRAAMLGLAVGLFAAACRTGFRVPRRVVAVGVLVLCAGAAFYASPYGWPLRSRTRWFIEDPWGGARPLLWRDSLRMASARPVLGFGPEVFTATFPHYESRELARSYPDFAHESPHNILLDAFVSQGAPGLACLAAFCAIGLVAAWRGNRRWILAALAAGCVAQQFTSFTIPTALLFYVTVALATRSAEPRHASWSRLPLAALGVLLCYGALRYAAADRQLELARRGIEARDLRAAAVHYHSYEGWTFPGARADLWYSRALLAAHAIVPAGQAALSAVRRPEEPFNTWYNLAELYAIGNTPQQTEDALRRAASAHPNWFKPHWMLAQVLLLEGRPDEAMREAALAADLDGGKHAEVGRTLAQLRTAAK